jgi:hypothetical protein
MRRSLVMATKKPKAEGMPTIMVKRLGRHPLTLIGKRDEVDRMQRAISHTTSSSRWLVGATPTEADWLHWASASNQREVTREVEQGTYLADLHQFRAVHGYSGEYQKGWQEKGPAEPRPRDANDAAIEAYYEHCRINQIDSGD